MLILTRRPGESILISIPGSDEQIEVRVMQAGTQAKLGINAPQDEGAPPLFHSRIAAYHVSNFSGDIPPYRNVRNG